MRSFKRWLRIMRWVSQQNTFAAFSSYTSSQPDLKTIFRLSHVNAAALTAIKNDFQGGLSSGENLVQLWQMFSSAHSLLVIPLANIPFKKCAVVRDKRQRSSDAASVVVQSKRPAPIMRCNALLEEVLVCAKSSLLRNGKLMQFV